MDFKAIKERIVNELKKNRYTIGDLTEGIGVTDTGFRQMFEKETLKLKTLYDVAQWLDMPLCYFLDPDDTHLFRTESRNKGSIETRLDNLEKQNRELITKIDELELLKTIH